MKTTTTTTTAKTATTELNGIKYIISKDYAINTRNGEMLSIEEFTKLMPNNKKGGSNKFKNDWMTLETNEMIDIQESIKTNIDEFNIFSQMISMLNDDGYKTESKVSIIVDKRNVSDSFILRTHIATYKDGKEVNSMNMDGFSPYTIKNGVTNTMLYYSNLMDCTSQLLEALEFNDCGEGMYINSKLECIVDTSNDVLYFKEIKVNTKKIVKVEVFDF